jgi:hypothetical protein
MLEVSRDAVAAGEEELVSCAAEQSKHCFICTAKTCGDMLEAMARIAPSQPNEAMARIAPHSPLAPMVKNKILLVPKLGSLKYIQNCSQRAKKFEKRIELKRE